MSPAQASIDAFRWPVRVYYEDTDAGGVVYHATYLHFLERARTEWLRALGFEQDRLRAELGVLFTVRRLAIDYLRPARFNDALIATAAIGARGRANLEFEQRLLLAADDSLCARAQVNVVCVDADRMRPVRIPEPILSAIDSENAHGH